MTRVCRLATWLAGVVVLAACSAPMTSMSDKSRSEAPAPPAVISGGAVLLISASVDGAISQSGSADVVIEVASLQGGGIRMAPGSASQPNATSMEFPSFSPDPENYPRAALRVTNASDHDAFNPGVSSFSFGADFRLDDQSWDETGVDNGDNLIQRGIMSDPVMFKAELDLRRPSCTVRGAAGTVTVRSAQPIDTGHWYQMRCQRTDDLLTVQVTDLEFSGEGSTTSRTLMGRTGDVSFKRLSIPVSIGGKLAHEGSLIRSATDQFNGLIAYPTIVLD